MAIEDNFAGFVFRHCIYRRFYYRRPEGARSFREVCGAGFIGLICVWFGDEMSDWVGTTIRMQLITSPSPGSLVRFIGWVLLSIPYVSLVIYKAL